MEASLKDEFFRLEKANTDLGNDESSQAVKQLKTQLDQIIVAKDEKLANALLEEIQALFVQLTFVYQLMNFIRSYDEQFNQINWKDRNSARQLLNRGLQMISGEPEVNQLHPVVVSIIDLLPPDQQPVGDDSVLVG